MNAISMSFKSLSFALIFSMSIHLLMSQGLIFKLPVRSVSPQPHFIFWGSILKSSDIEEITFKAPPSLISPVSLEPPLDKNDTINSVITFEKPVSAKILTEKQNLKSHFEIVDVQSHSQPQIQDTLDANIRPYKPLQFP